mmetsp:Transcript_61294/g.193068  ORF Transcript_61294/g.193068 Transcript_61294/m.193068 type:complete len:438 (+) Transcript_61294:3-1316(+)
MDCSLSGAPRPASEGPQLVDVLQLSGGPSARRSLSDCSAAAAAPIVVLSDDEGTGSGGSSSSSAGAVQAVAPGAVAAAEDFTRVDVAEQQRLLAFYAKQVTARNGGSKPPPRVPSVAKQLPAKKAPGKRKAADTPPPPRKVRPQQPKNAEEAGAGGEEARGKRFVPKPSAQVRERIDRAFAHRMYLLAARPEPADAPGGPAARLDVLGSTGNVYTVTLGRPCQSCTCVDYAKQPNRVCKHILFVMLRVCRLPQNDPRVWQTALTPAEAKPLVEGLPSREELASQGDDVLASGPVLRGFDQARAQGEASQAQQRPLADDPDCPICFEPLQGGAAAEAVVVSWCRSCGHNAHHDCIQRWHGARGGSSCPLCRGHWGSSTDAAEAGRHSAPLNLASLAGIQAPTLDSARARLWPGTIATPQGLRARWRRPLNRGHGCVHV